MGDTKNDYGSTYYVQNVQVNEFKSDSLFSVPITILEGQLATIDEVIQRRYQAGAKACEQADMLHCRLSSFRFHISRDNVIVDKYILKFVTQLELEQVRLEQFILQEAVNAWRDVCPFVLKRLEVEKILAEEKSRLELIAASDPVPSLPRRNEKRERHGTPRFPNSI